MSSPVETSTIEQLFDLKVTAGRITDVTGPSVAVRAGKAADDGIALGDTVSMTFARTGPVELTVRALYDEPLPNVAGDGFLIGIDTFQAHVTDQFDQQLFVKVADGIGPAQSSAALESVLASWPMPTCRTRPPSRAASPARST